MSYPSARSDEASFALGREGGERPRRHARRWYASSPERSAGRPVPAVDRAEGADDSSSGASAAHRAPSVGVDARRYSRRGLLRLLHDCGDRDTREPARGRSTSDVRGRARARDPRRRALARDAPHRDPDRHPLRPRRRPWRLRGARRRAPPRTVRSRACRALPHGRRRVRARRPSFDSRARAAQRASLGLPPLCTGIRGDQPADGGRPLLRRRQRPRAGAADAVDVRLLRVHPSLDAAARLRHLHLHRARRRRRICRRRDLLGSGRLPRRRERARVARSPSRQGVDPARQRRGRGLRRPAPAS